MQGLQPIYNTTEISITSSECHRSLLQLLPKRCRKRSIVAGRERRWCKDEAIRACISSNPDNSQLNTHQVWRSCLHPVADLRLASVENDRKRVPFPVIGDFLTASMLTNLPPSTEDKNECSANQSRVVTGTDNRFFRRCGKWKNLVALMSMLMAIWQWFQGCIMAPTESATNIWNDLSINWRLGLKVELLTGSIRSSKR